MEVRFVSLAGIVAGAVMLAAGFFAWIDRKRVPGKDVVRRGAGNALLGLQQFIEPSVESVFQARNVEQKDREDVDDAGPGGDKGTVRTDLAAALAFSSVDPEQVRRHLAAAAHLGLDWRSLFDQAVADELRERPFRAPSLPPAQRVAPRV